MNRDDAVRVVAVRMYGGRRWESLADEQRTYWLTMAEAAVAALVAAGWGDLAAERERLAAEAPVVTQYTAAGVALAAASGTDVAWICVDDVRDAFTALAADRDALRARLTAERERLAAAVEAMPKYGNGGNYDDGYDQARSDAARLIRETPEETT
jgi:hypothetical protein